MSESHKAIEAPIKKPQRSYGFLSATAAVLLTGAFVIADGVDKNIALEARKTTATNPVEICRRALQDRMMLVTTSRDGYNAEMHKNFSVDGLECRVTLGIETIRK